MTERDYAAEMNVIFDAVVRRPRPASKTSSVFASVGDGTPDAEPRFVPAIAAQDLAVRLRAEDPELLAGWLDMQLEPALTAELVRRQRSAAARERHDRPKLEFAAAASEFERTGDPAVLEQWRSGLNWRTK